MSAGAIDNGAATASATRSLLVAAYATQRGRRAFFDWKLSRLRVYIDAAVPRQLISRMHFISYRFR